MLRFIKKFSLMLALVIFICGSGYILVQYYSLIFSKTVKGKAIKVSKVNDTIAVMGSGAVNSQIYSFAVAIKTPEGVIYTSSTEDRQWAAVTEGFCVEARLYPYPPWNFEKADTYFGARLIHMMECK